jgi:hypothetical protein
VVDFRDNLALLRQKHAGARVAAAAPLGRPRRFAPAAWSGAERTPPAASADEPLLSLQRRVELPGAVEPLLGIDGALALPLLWGTATAE